MRYINKRIREDIITKDNYKYEFSNNTRADDIIGVLVERFGDKAIIAKEGFIEFKNILFMTHASYYGKVLNIETRDCNVNLNVGDYKYMLVGDRDVDFVGDKGYFFESGHLF